jgi:hypothetical protein
MTEFEKSVSESLSSLAKSFSTLADIATKLAIPIVNNDNDPNNDIQQEELNLRKKEQEIHLREIEARERDLSLREAEVNASNNEA